MHCLWTLLLLACSVWHKVEARKTVVIIIAQGRSGSTALLNAVREAGEAFVIGEPFYRFQHPTQNYLSLLDCSFLNDPATARKVYWTFNCKQTPFIAQDPKRLFYCKQGLLDDAAIKVLLAQCLAANMVVLKTIRFLGSTHGLTTAMRVRGWTVKVIHLLRDPWAMLRSQLRAGWLSLPSESEQRVGITLEASTAQTSTSADAISIQEQQSQHHLFSFAFIEDLRARCQRVLSTAEMLARAVPAHALLTLAYEHVQHDSAGLHRMLDFLNISASERRERARRVLQGARFANMPRSHMHEAYLQAHREEELVAVVARIPACVSARELHERARAE
jgi:hypothetical protein